MSLLSKILGSEPEEDDEEEEPEPETKLWGRIETDVTRTNAKRKAEIRFNSGRTETVEYHGHYQEGDKRVYQLVEEYQAELNRTYNGYNAVINYHYKPVKEVYMANVESIDIVEEKEETFTAPIEFDDCIEHRRTNALKNYLEGHEDGELYEKEVDDESAE